MRTSATSKWIKELHSLSTLLHKTRKIDNLGKTQPSLPSPQSHSEIRDFTIDFREASIVSFQNAASVDISTDLSRKGDPFFSTKAYPFKMIFSL